MNIQSRSSNSFTSRRIVVLGAGPYQVDTLKSLAKAGFYILALDRNGKSPGFAYAHNSEVVDIKDKVEVYRASLKFKADGIMPLNDFGTRSAYYTAQRLNLPGSSYLTGICTNDKFLMRQIWDHDDLPQPNYSCFRDLETLKGCNLTFPSVIKPSDSGGGSRGVSLIWNMEDLENAWVKAKPYAMSQRYIIEEFIDGIECTIESIVYSGKVFNLAISDKEIDPSTACVSKSINFMADLPEIVIKQVYKVVTNAIESLGIINGAVHTEVIVSRDLTKVSLIETASRGGGGHIFSKIIEEVTGVDAPIQLGNIVCGLKPDLEPKRKSFCTYRFLESTKVGKIKSISVDESVHDLENLIEFKINVKVGQEINGLNNDHDRLGFIITKGKNRETAIETAKKVDSMINIVI